jgi:SAM-dependent methyltransferase
VWDPKAFDAAYMRFIAQDSYPFGTPAYYARYKSRYKMLLERFCRLAPAVPVDVLDVGGGQLALLANKMWGDRSSVSDLPGEKQLEYLSTLGITPLIWNLCRQEQPCVAAYDFIFFSEVIEHLPIPGYLPLQLLRKALKPGGTLICSTPNLYRLRNVVQMALGRPITDYWQEAGNGSLGHVIEYSRDHLKWQLERAGFQRCVVEYRQMHHSPMDPVYRVMSWIGYPLFLVPRFRDNLVAVAVAP